MPSIRTGRLLLSPPVLEDAPAVYAIAGDPRAVEHNPSDQLLSEPQAEALVRRWMDHWQQFRFGYCGIKVVTFQEVEAVNLIYRFAPTAWGRGLAAGLRRAPAYNDDGEHGPDLLFTR